MDCFDTAYLFVGFVSVGREENLRERLLSGTRHKLKGTLPFLGEFDA